jgi:hypothetical protein
MNTMRTETKTGCSSCAVLYINGVKCHEHGCPDAWMDELRKCKWCRSDFRPEYREQVCCDYDCENAYYN